MMNEVEILETLNKCETRGEVESLWTRTYLKNGDNAWGLFNHFEEKRTEVANPVQMFSESYKANGWD